MMKLSFDIHLGESRKKITSDQLDELAISYGLDRIAQGRYSSLFVLNLLVLERMDGIPHHFVVDEIKAETASRLRGGLSGSSTGRGCGVTAPAKIRPVGAGIWTSCLRPG
jgi:hypothetical protein